MHVKIKLDFSCQDPTLVSGASVELKLKPMHMNKMRTNFFINFRGVVIVLKQIIKVQQQVKNNLTMCDTFQQTLEKHRDKVAFIFEDKHWTFQEVEYFSNKVANYFKSIGYKKGDVVALFMENRPELVFFWLGLAKIGIISALINFNLRKQSLTHCISIVNAKGLIYSSDASIAGNSHSVNN